MTSTQFQFQTSARERIADATAIIMVTPARVRTGFKDLAKTLGIDLADHLKEFTGQPSELFSISIDGHDHLTDLYVIGSGTGGPEGVRLAAATVARRLAQHTHLHVLGLEEVDDARFRAFVEGLVIGSYRFSVKKVPATTIQVSMATSRSRKAAIARGQVTGSAVHLGRDLANTPSNIKTPQWLVAQANKVAKAHGLDIDVRTGARLAREGFGGIVAVGAGSQHRPALVELRYRPKKVTAQTKRLVLVGKGITFDSGGLSLKPADAMVPMKTDMSGSAAVLAAMQATAQLQPNVEVIGLLAIAENMISGSAFRPSDVITHFGGTTVEVVNTDAEGRLVLADALAYADLTLNPDVIVDIATLTGAASLGLGRIHGAMYATSSAVAKRWQKAATAAGEPVWQMPLVDEYAGSLASTVADLGHISTGEKVGAGSITAALFLQHFVGNRAWIHLDIAGPARSDTDKGLINRGGTAYGTASLIRWIESFSE
ncbi:MAG: leucyl aminopeptidase family protein [Actinomycetes bacterium]